MRTSKLSGVYPAFLNDHDEKPDQATSSIQNSSICPTYVWQHFP
jgi:hypothetical protein